MNENNISEKKDNDDDFLSGIDKLHSIVTENDNNINDRNNPNENPHIDKLNFSNHTTELGTTKNLQEPHNLVPPDNNNQTINDKELKDKLQKESSLENNVNKQSFTNNNDTPTDTRNTKKSGKQYNKKNNDSKGKSYITKENGEKKSYKKNYINYIKLNNAKLEDMDYTSHLELINQNYYFKELNNKPNIKSDHIDINICYSSKSEKSLDESDDDSSTDSVDNFYENICQEDPSLDFYKNSLNAKNTKIQSNYENYFNSKNNATEEIDVLNNYIKTLTEQSQKSSSHMDIDNKLINILSLSFLTFIDHVIYDSHIYALKNQITSDTQTTDHINSISPEDALKIINNPSTTNAENNDTKENQNTTTNNMENIINSNIMTNFETSKDNNELINNSKEVYEQKTPQIVYNPDVINLCLNNLYNQKLVNDIINKEKIKTEHNNHTNKTDNNNNKDIKKDINIFNNYSHNDTNITDIQNSTNFNHNQGSFQMKLANKLQQRELIINKINEKIKQNSENISNFVNSNNYSIEDIFEL
ncbi:hypothetical protein YYG_00677 [Plasmodium vinckei petteri]|uniref:Uncharacterized protein n=1 Tax=Plasmodium vinckei petteri TaxID=138298 RepID=W7B9A7_PLAVN|nr:hypothetical protein YYG_00677 [Plasmodium vinckei petteri]CAD2114513.1 conserved Plasmodium protein, unknown function [Plasmodium vinckei petteri]